MPGNESAAARRRTVAGLYAVTPDEADTASLCRKVEAALAGGARIVQYRNKGADAALAREQAAALAAICRRHGVPLIINDHVQLALDVGADGVHLGGEDGDLAAARRVLGPQRLLGASCYNRYELAEAARAAGVDYVAFGAAFASSTKPGAVSAPPALYARAHAELGLPVVAIGGITAANAASLIAVGVDAVAVISDVFNAPDVTVSARAFAKLFESRQ